MAIIQPPVPAAPLPAPVLAATPLKSYQEADSQSLFYRFRAAAGTTQGPLSVIEFFTVKSNQAPHLTNCEEIGSMPNTSLFSIAAIEIVPNAKCSAQAFRELINASRLIITVGTKRIEKVNQPAIFFGSSQHGSLADNTAVLRTGMYQLSKGEEICLDADQPFRAYLQMDDVGFTVPQNEVLDIYLRFWGQKRGKIALG